MENRICKGVIIKREVKNQVFDKLIKSHSNSSYFTNIIHFYQINLYILFGHLRKQTILYFWPQIGHNKNKCIKNSFAVVLYVRRVLMIVQSISSFPLHLLIEVFLLNDIIFLKRSSIQTMTFLYFINNGFATLASIEHFQSFHQNLTSIYTQIDELNQTSFYPQTWAQSQLYTKCETVSQPLGQGIKENISNHIIKKKSDDQSTKKKMEKTVEKQILSAKKNSQSNIINQFFSFFSSKEKSEKILEKCASLLGESLEQVQKIVSIFYAVIRFINTKRGRKYVNVSMFLKFFTPEDFSEYLGQMKAKIDSLEYLNVEQLCEIFRRCIKYFLKSTSINAILTSKRISVISKEEHLIKRRKLLNAVIWN